MKEERQEAVEGVEGWGFFFWGGGYLVFKSEKVVGEVKTRSVVSQRPTSHESGHGEVCAAHNDSPVGKTPPQKNSAAAAAPESALINHQPGEREAFWEINCSL